MRQFRHRIIKTGFEALHMTGAYRWFRPFAGAGAIFKLHHVRPPRGDAFQPNRHLEIAPEYLRTVLRFVRDRGLDIVTLDEVQRRLTDGDLERSFVAFVFDDGYRDNRDHALPLMKEFDAPFTVYVTSDFAAGRGKLWWLTLERIIAGTTALDITLDGACVSYRYADARQRQQAFTDLHCRLRELPTDAALHQAMDDLCTRQGVDPSAVARELCLSWDELRSFAAEPLVTIGAHSVSHCMLAKSPPEHARAELEESRARIEAEIGRPVRHLAYPYGDRDAANGREFEMAHALGFATAGTTRPGMLYAENAAHLHALPCISLNGNYQDERMLDVLTSGAATALWNGFRRLNVA
jgi:peptidoglycan/xylan/chitin deacetylase (PgdA/CDA1 family)